MTKTMTAILAASAFGLLLAATPAGAQNDQYSGDQYDNDQYQGDQYDDQSSYGDQDQYDDAGDGAYDESAVNEEVEVTAPRLNVERRPMLQPPGKISMSRTVTYADLDLRTVEGASELRDRVRETAGAICDELREIDPLPEAQFSSCYTRASRDAMLRASAAIDSARHYANYEGYEE